MTDERGGRVRERARGRANTVTIHDHDSFTNTITNTFLHRARHGGVAHRDLGSLTMVHRAFPLDPAEALRGIDWTALFNSV